MGFWSDPHLRLACPFWEAGSDAVHNYAGIRNASVVDSGGGGVVEWVPSEFGPVARFKDNDGWLDFGDTEKLGLPLAGGSDWVAMEAILRVNVGGTLRTIVESRDTSGWWLFGFLNDEEIRVFVDGGNSPFLGNYVTLGQWHHIVAMWEMGVGAHFWIDGAYSFGAFVTNPSGVTGQAVDVGRTNAGGADIDIAMLNVWDREVTDAEVQEWYADPWARFRHHRDTTHPTIYPIQRGISQQFSKKPPAKPDPWNIEASLVGVDWQWFWEAKHLGIGYSHDDPATLRDLVRGSLATIQDGPLSLGQASWGRGVATVIDTQDSVQWPLPQGFVTTDPWTLLWYGQVDDANGSDTIFSLKEDGLTEWVSVGMYQEVTSLLAWKIISNAETPGDSGVEVDLGKSYLVALVYDGTDFHLYVDGVFLYSVTPTGVDWQDADRFTFGLNAAGNTSAAAVHAWVSVRQGLVSREQMSQLVSDPFGPFRHHRDTDALSRYPIQRGFSKTLFGRKIPMKPAQWNVQKELLAAPFNQLPTLKFAWECWEKGGYPYDRITGTMADVTGSSGNSFDLYRDESFGNVRDHAPNLDPTISGSRFGWTNLPGLQQWLEQPAGNVPDITIECFMYVSRPVDPENAGLRTIFQMAGFQNGNTMARHLNTTNGDPIGLLQIRRRYSGPDQNANIISEEGRDNGGLPPERWFHFTALYPGNGSPQSVYIDGKRAGQGSGGGSTGSGDTQGGSNDIYIAGNDDDSQVNFQGSMAYFRVYDGLLSPYQIRMLSADPFGPIRHYRETLPLNFVRVITDDGQIILLKLINITSISGIESIIL